jgi:hypothetical protein
MRSPSVTPSMSGRNQNGTRPSKMRAAASSSAEKYGA